MAIELFFSAVSAISAVTQIMMMQDERLQGYKFPELRSQQPRTNLPREYTELVSSLNQEASAAAKEAYNPDRWSKSLKPELARIERRIPQEIIEAMKDKVQRCWTRLLHFISSDQYTPEERKRAHVFARQCVCNELQEMLNYLEELPPDLQGYWNACGCPTPLELLNTAI